MKVLIIKTSSMGDIIHTLPALTDAGKYCPNIQFDWVVEEAFAEIPAWHPLVKKVIPIAWRRWRKKWFSLFFNKEWRQFRQQLTETNYDLIIDAQGLLKSAIITRMAKGVRCGLNFRAAWESMAALFYQRCFYVDPQQHAVNRVRQLFAQVLNYAVPAAEPNYGIKYNDQAVNRPIKPYILFIHGTTWRTKEWPQIHWAKLANYLIAAGYEIKIPWGNSQEKKRAEMIAESSSVITVLPKSNLNELAGMIACARAIISVDTGLGHLAAAFNIPTISLYGPTHPDEIGTRGAQQIHLYAAFNCKACSAKQCCYEGKKSAVASCLTIITPEAVMKKLEEKLII